MLEVTGLTRAFGSRPAIAEVLLVTHDIDESVYTGDRVVVLSYGPGRIVADLPVGLPAPRDQIVTKELPEFTRLRGEVSRLVRASRQPEPC